MQYIVAALTLPVGFKAHLQWNHNLPAPLFMSSYPHNVNRWLLQGSQSISVHDSFQQRAGRNINDLFLRAVNMSTAVTLCFCFQLVLRLLQGNTFSWYLLWLCSGKRRLINQCLGWSPPSDRLCPRPKTAVCFSAISRANVNLLCSEVNLHCILI